MLKALEIILYDIPRFLVMVCAAYFAGDLAVKIKLPAITGYLIAGIIVGPYVLGQVTKDQVSNLAFINSFALASIAFSAGSELYFPEIRNLFRIVSLHMISILLSTFILVSTAVFLISPVVPFLKDLNTGCQVNIALLTGAVMIARSPSSALAIFCELKANGPITLTSLGVTVVSDVVLLVLFSLTATFTRAQCGSDGIALSSLLGLLLALFLCLLLGYLLGHLLVLFLWIPKLSSPQRGMLILPAGFLTFIASHWFKNFSKDVFGFQVAVEPLLLCMVASCMAGNESSNRRKFANILHKSSPYIFLPFFTLTGASIDIIDLGNGALLLLVLVFCRFIAVVGSTFLAGKYIAQVSPSHYRYIGLTLLAQAGTALGLSNEIKSYGDWGKKTSAALFGVVVVNQLVGLILCKWAIKQTGECGKEGILSDIVVGSKHDEVRIIGVNSLSVCIASRLSNVPRNVVMIRSNAVQDHIVRGLMEKVQSLDHARGADFSRITLLPNPLNLELWRRVYEDLVSNGDILSEKDKTKELTIFTYNQDQQDLAKDIDLLVPSSASSIVLALPNDKMNLICCRLLRKFRSLPLRIVVIIKDASLAFLFQREEAIVIYPPSLVASQVTDAAYHSEILAQSFFEMIHPLESNTKCNVKIYQTDARIHLNDGHYSPQLSSRSLLDGRMGALESFPECNFNELSSLVCLGLADERIHMKRPQLRRGPSVLLSLTDGSLEDVLERERKESEPLLDKLQRDTP